MEYEWIWYLFVDGKIIKKSKNIEELKQDIVNMQLYIDTTPYYCKLDTIKLLNDFSDTHEGVWFPICDVLNEENKIVDVFIVEEFYSYQDKEWEEWENEDLAKTFSFNTEYETIDITDENKYGITMQELQAINKKVEELRWRK